MAKFKLSKYVLPVEVATHENDLLSKVVLFSTRTGRSLVMTKGAYQLVTNNHLDPIPTKFLIRLIGAEILIPEGENETQIVLNRIHKVDEIVLLLDHQVYSSESLQKNLISGLGEFFQLSTYKSIRLLTKLTEEQYEHIYPFITQLNEIAKCTINLVVDPLEGETPGSNFISQTETKQIFIELKNYDQESLASYSKILPPFLKSLQEVRVGYFLNCDAVEGFEDSLKSFLMSLFRDHSPFQIHFVSYNESKEEVVARNEVTLMRLINELNIRQGVTPNLQNMKVIGNRNDDFFSKARFVTYDLLAEAADLHVIWDRINSECESCDLLPICGGVNIEEPVGNHACPKVKINLEDRLRLSYEIDHTAN